MAADMTGKPMIQRLTNRSRSFYRLLGPFLSRREIVKEIGGPIWDDDDKVWFVALADGAVIGFCAARDAGNTVVFQSTYVLSDWRHQGVYRALFAARLADYPDRRVRAVCTAASLPMFLAHGFVEVRQKGSFTEVFRDGN